MVCRCCWGKRCSAAPMSLSVRRRRRPKLANEHYLAREEWGGVPPTLNGRNSRLNQSTWCAAWEARLKSPITTCLARSRVAYRRCRSVNLNTVPTNPSPPRRKKTRWLLSNRRSPRQRLYRRLATPTILGAANTCGRDVRHWRVRGGSTSPIPRGQVQKVQRWPIRRRVELYREHGDSILLAA